MPGLSATSEATLGGSVPPPTPHQQLREILGQQTKLRMQQKAAAAQMGQLQQQWPEGMPPTSLMQPRMPGETARLLLLYQGQKFDKMY